MCVRACVCGAATSLWILFHHRRLDDLIVPVWMEQVTNPATSSDKKLVLLYLANDAMQNGKKRGQVLVDPWLRVLVDAVAASYEAAVLAERTNKSVGERTTSSAIRRLCAVWKDREVVLADILAVIDARLAAVDAALPAPVAPVAPAATPQHDDVRLRALNKAWEAAQATPPSRPALQALADLLFSEAALVMQELERVDAAASSSSVAPADGAAAPATKKHKADAPPTAPMYVAPPVELQNVSAHIWFRVFYVVCVCAKVC